MEETLEEKYIKAIDAALERIEKDYRFHLNKNGDLSHGTHIHYANIKNGLSEIKGYLAVKNLENKKSE